MDTYSKTNTEIDANVLVFLNGNVVYKKEEGLTYTANSAMTVLNIWSDKDVTYLLIQGAQDYLARQRLAAQQVSSARDARILLNSQIIVTSDANAATCTGLLSSIENQSRHR